MAERRQFLVASVKVEEKGGVRVGVGGVQMVFSKYESGLLSWAAKRTNGSIQPRAEFRRF